MVRVERIRLADLRKGRLTTALDRWQQLCGADRIYPREELGFGLLIATPEIMNGHSLVIDTSTDRPIDFVIAFYGSDLEFYEGRSLVAHRFRDLPDQDVAEAAVAAYDEAISERQPIAHRVRAGFGHQTFEYDQLILPTKNEFGKIDRLVTVIEERVRHRLRAVTAGEVMIDDNTELRAPFRQLDDMVARAREILADQADSRSASIA